MDSLVKRGGGADRTRQDRLSRQARSLAHDATTVNGTLFTHLLAMGHSREHLWRRYAEHYHPAASARRRRDEAPGLCCSVCLA